MSYDNKKTEDEWFARNEAELLKSLKRERERREAQVHDALKADEARKQKDLHWMKCPKCGSDLQEKDREGLKLDECPLCQGIFLDRNELEQLVEERGKHHSLIFKVLDVFHKFK